MHNQSITFFFIKYASFFLIDRHTCTHAYLKYSNKNSKNLIRIYYEECEFVIDWSASQMTHNNSCFWCEEVGVPVRVIDWKPKMNIYGK